MSKKSKYIIFIILFMFAIGTAAVLYLFNMPHRDVQAAHVDYKLNATQLVEEYLSNGTEANIKYLSSDGESKVLELSGKIIKLDIDLNNNTVLLLEAVGYEAGVSCTFSESTNVQVEDVQLLDNITLKGVIRAGANYDEDLELYENAILEKCSIIK